jgi:hypothetical protein
MSNDKTMRDADVANGEDPDEANRQPEDRPAPTERDQQPASVPTGERQADENRENDPPA